MLMIMATLVRGIRSDSGRSRCARARDEAILCNESSAFHRSGDFVSYHSSIYWKRSE